MRITVAQIVRSVEAQVMALLVRTGAESVNICCDHLPDNVLKKLRKKYEVKKEVMSYYRFTIRHGEGSQ